MLCLNMKFHSINLSPNLVDSNDTVRLSITTLPDKQKEYKNIDVKNMNNTSIPFKVKFNEKTEVIIIVFRKKSFFSDDPIIASTCIKTKNIGIYKENASETHMKINIYESIKNTPEKENKARKIVGNMEINFSLKEDYAIKTYGITVDNIEQRTLRKKLNNLNSHKSKENQYIFN